MTAEIAVMNRIGVALAADSAVTIGSSANKIYTSAEKLFQLSDVAPVGIMIYGNAGYVSLPWETIIKTFRKRLGLHQRKTIQEYATEFIAFLNNNPELFPVANRLGVMKKLLRTFFLETVTGARKEVLNEERKERRLAKKQLLTPVEIGEIYLDVIDAIADTVKKNDEIPGIDQGIRDEVAAGVPEMMKNIISTFFGSIPKPTGADDKLIALAIDYLLRQSLGSDLLSGIVIAGFGSEEYMPALTTFQVEECASVLPRMSPPEFMQIDPQGNRSYIMPYAQTDTVVHFLFGLDSDLSQFMTTSVENTMEGIVDAIMGKVEKENTNLASVLRNPIKSIVKDSLKNLFDGWDKQQSQYFYQVIETIAVLPKDELAAMAESFVNLTKFRRRATPVRETVSGPIDVAVITKGDGFVWIRRKHYFDPALNPRILARLHHTGGTHE